MGKLLEGFETAFADRRRDSDRDKRAGIALLGGRLVALAN